MKKIFTKLIIFTLIFTVTAVSVFASGETEGGVKVKKFSIFLGRPKEDYPSNGTMLGNFLEEKTGVRMKWEFPVGDLKQKIGLIIASGDFPDFIDGRNENQQLYDAGVFIPLNDLYEEYGVYSKKLYGEKVSMLYKDDGKFYWFPAIFPYGDKVQRTGENMGLYIQKAVLKEYGWPMPKNVNEAFDMLIDYAKKHPTIEGNRTYAFTALTAGWREFPLMNAPHVFSGHPNDGVINVDWKNGKYVVSHYYKNNDCYRIYKLYNKIFLEGLYDTESFVMDYDQYIAKLSTGSILAFHDQRWQFDPVNNLLKKQDKDRWYVGLPIVMDGYKCEFEGPPGPQVSEGVGITTDCKDPVTAFKFLDYLTSEEFRKLVNWGIEGEHYMVDDDGYFYRTPEQLEFWKDNKWRQQVFGQGYYSEIATWDGGSILSDGKNAIDARSQPNIFFAELLETEKEVLDAYHKKTWVDFFNQPDMKRMLYFPMWTIKIPTGSDIDICQQKVLETRRKYTPLLIMAEKGKYDEVWADYLAALEKIPDQDKFEQFYQDKLDDRVKNNGGYF